VRCTDVTARNTRLLRRSPCTLAQTRAAYRKRNTSYQPTRPTPNSHRRAGSRKPHPRRRPGYLRIDTVHSGRSRWAQGPVSHSTLWTGDAVGDRGRHTANLRMVAASGAGSHGSGSFPFYDPRLFIPNNGSEFINYNVGRLLGQTALNRPSHGRTIARQRPRFESKNGAIIRKHIGLATSDAQIRRGGRSVSPPAFEPYVTSTALRRGPKIITEANGKRRRGLLALATPWELFQEAPHCESYLRPGVDAGRAGWIRPGSVRYRSGAGDANAPSANY